jgi:peptidoglycan/xylan/chitin deacetylase (PgdA/CDA1 family)
MGEQADKLLGAVEFTHGWYGDFLDRLVTLGYEFRTFGSEPGRKTVHLRHDVDLSPAAALRMARIEAERDVRATYCFLLSSPLYNPLEAQHRERIRAIERLGHDVGLHFSTHEYWTADEQPAAEPLDARVADERTILSQLTDESVTTVSFHLPPDWVLDRSFESFENTYAPAYFGDITYVADSTQRWRADPPRPATLPASVQVLTHPGLWADSDGSFTERIDDAVTESCTHARRKARRELVGGVGGS